MDLSAVDSGEEAGLYEDVVLVSFGNPLLDMTAVVEDTALHEAFSLPTDGQLEVDENQQQLFSLVAEKYSVRYTAGGSALNSSRVFSWVLGGSARYRVSKGQGGCAVFIGGIGEDKQADQLTDIIHSSGVSTRLVRVAGQPTGRCVALVLDRARCLCAEIGAAAYCPPDHVFRPLAGVSLGRPLPELLAADLLYVEGYFITHSFNTAMQIAKFARANNKTFVFNLCGSYVCENHPEELYQLLPYVDIMFGFVEEYRTLEHHVDLDRLAAEHSGDSEEPTILTSLPRIMQAVRYNASVDDSARHLSTCDAEPGGCGNSDTITNTGTVTSNSGQHIDKKSGGRSSCTTTGAGDELECDDNKDVVSKNCSTNGTPDSNCSSNSHYFDNSDVLYEEECKRIKDDIDQVDKLAVKMDKDIDEIPSSSKTKNKCDLSKQKNVKTLNNGNDFSLNGTTGNGTKCVPSETNEYGKNYVPRESTPIQNEIHNRYIRRDSTTVLGKVIVITRGPDPILFVSNDGPVQERRVEPLDAGEIVDTTGAGDSFVGGFLAAVSSGRSLETCVDCGVWTARHILKQKGCTLPDYPATYL